MKLFNYGYFFAEAFKNLFKNRLMTFASILTAASCAVIFIVTFCVVANVDYILEQIEDTGVISAFIEDSASGDAVSQLYARVKEIDHVTLVDYISYEMAVSQYSKMFENEDSDLLESIALDNALPRSFEVHIDAGANEAYVAAELEQFLGYGLEKIRRESDVTNALVAVNKGIRTVSAVVVATLSFMSVIIIMNTIKMSVNYRKTEIQIMQTVGATDAFIRRPFTIEGVFIGLAGALLPSGAALVTYDRILEAVKHFEFLSGVASFKTTDEIFWFVIPVTALAGGFLGSLASMLSAKSHYHYNE